jgi:hypothetical protein
LQKFAHWTLAYLQFCKCRQTQAISLAFCYVVI